MLRVHIDPPASFLSLEVTEVGLRTAIPVGASRHLVLKVVDPLVVELPKGPFVEGQLPPLLVFLAYFLGKVMWWLREIVVPDLEMTVGVYRYVYVLFGLELCPYNTPCV